MKNQAVIDLGIMAKDIRHAPHFDEVIEHIRTDIARKMVRTNPAEREQRDDLHLKAYGLEMFVAYLDQFIANARFENEKHNELDQG